MKCDINVNTVECDGWQWLETEFCRRGKWRRYCCYSAAEEAGTYISLSLSCLADTAHMPACGMH
jgi:hypothetical protein